MERVAPSFEVKYVYVWKRYYLLAVGESVDYGVTAFLTALEEDMM